MLIALLTNYAPINLTEALGLWSALRLILQSVRERKFACCSFLFIKNNKMETRYHYTNITPIFGSQFCEIVLPLIESAESEIKIIVFNWRIPFLTSKLHMQSFNDALVRAVGRGVVVRAIVSSERVVAELSRFGIMAKRLPFDRRLHTKLMIIDGRQIVVGSHNYSESAFNKNYEVSVFFEEYENQNKYVGYFDNLWAS
jgi:phosphatidylserine/phosphatidylglycerophosphate/cardiolipin synthase-like enzyme